MLTNNKIHVVIQPIAFYSQIFYFSSVNVDARVVLEILFFMSELSYFEDIFDLSRYCYCSCISSCSCS